MPDPVASDGDSCAVSECHHGERAHADKHPRECQVKGCLCSSYQAPGGRAVFFNPGPGNKGRISFPLGTTADQARAWGREVGERIAAELEDAQRRATGITSGTRSREQQEALFHRFLGHPDDSDTATQIPAPTRPIPINLMTELRDAIITGTQAICADLADMARGQYTGRHSQAWLDTNRRDPDA